MSYDETETEVDRNRSSEPRYASLAVLPDGDGPVLFAIVVENLNGTLAVDQLQLPV